MEFYSAWGERPRRLSERTRAFAWDSLQGKYGDETMQTLGVSLDEIPGFADLTAQQKYDAAIREIARSAPVRICPHERIAGAATLGRGIWHEVPATYQGKVVFRSISHLTLGFERVLREGLDAIQEEIRERLAGELTPGQREVLGGMESAIESLRLWHRRYLDALEDRPDLARVLGNLPFAPAETFHEAVQSLWFAFAFTRLCGNWSGIGRIDEMLGPYLERDLALGIQTLDEAREILAHFFIKGCEWIQSEPPRGSGDAQHYQNIILAGVNAQGHEITNPVTYLVLDIVEELGISEFPISVRLSQETPPELLTRVSEIIRHGGGVVAIYNEPLIIQALTEFGYSVKDARRFANDGCWEVQIPGETYFAYHPFDSLQILAEIIREGQDYPDMASLYQDYLRRLRRLLEEIYQRETQVRGEFQSGDWVWKQGPPSSVVDLFTRGCDQTGRSYLSGGPRYTVLSPHIGGAPDVGNSLHAINQLVFVQKKLSLGNLWGLLQANWEGNEPLRQVALNKILYYGNDDDEADSFTVRILDDFADLCLGLNGRSPILFPPGVSTFGRQIEWAPFRPALPTGRRQGEILSGNASPTPGTDLGGATATICSYCKANLRKQVCGAALDLRLYPGSLQGENGIKALVSLMEGFVQLGGFFLQVDVFDPQILLQAQENPQAYKTLSVRVSGWNARFVTLNEEWQQMIIQQITQGE